MKDLSNTIPGYRVYEYLLVLNPHDELRNKRWGKPHLTLVNFLQYGLMEDRIANRLRMIAMGYHPVKIELKDYGSFPSHTIYINVTS